MFIGIAEGIRARVFAITLLRIDVRADAQATQTELTARLTAFMKPDFVLVLKQPLNLRLNRIHS